MKVLVPIEITDAMLTSCTIAEPDSGETAWVSAGTYALGDERIRTTTHKTYYCILGHTGRTALPENDFSYWEEKRPTNRWAQMDSTVSTDSTATASMTIVLQPGFFNAVALYKLTGAAISVSVKDSPSGSIFFSYSGDLFEPFADWYEWLFDPYRQLTKLVLSDILPYDTAELTITVTAGAGETVGIGMICVGDLRSFISSSNVGGTQYGARVEPVDYSLIKTDDYGNTRIVKRPATTGMNVSIFLPQADTDYALSVLQDVLSTPAAWIASEHEGYAGLSVFGIGSGSIEYASPGHSIGNITVKGLI